MNKAEALKILGLERIEGKTELKKQYRKLMRMVHPDVSCSVQNDTGSVHSVDYPYAAHEINAAYEFLLALGDKYMGAVESYGSENRRAGTGESFGYDNRRAGQAGTEEYAWSRKHRAERGTVKHWNAPVNETARWERNIYQYVEGPDGEIQGKYPAARGKYYWTKDEDFKLFLLSIYDCSRKLLEQNAGSSIPGEQYMKYQAELAYLLAQQYIKPAALLDKYRIEEDLYYIPAMLETGGKASRLPEGSVLIPSAMKQHRLYVKSQGSKSGEAGYISFADDTLYYGVIPLMEDRHVQVKMRIGGEVYGNNSVRKVKVKIVDLWLKLIPTDENRLAQTLNNKIEKLLERVRALL